MTRAPQSTSKIQPVTAGDLNPLIQNLDLASELIESAGLDDNGLPGAEIPPDPVPREIDAVTLRRSVELVCASEHRKQAWQRIAQQIKEEVGTSSLQIILFHSQSTFVLDQRWGWLPEGNELRERAIRATEPIDSPSDSNTDASDRHGEESHVWIRIGDRQRVWRAYVRVEVDPDDIDAIRRCRLWQNQSDFLFDLVNSRPRWKSPLAWLPNRGRPSVVVCILAAMLCVGAVIPASYRVKCQAVVAPYRPRVVASPFDATLLCTHVEPGDLVVAGQTLVELDGRPLKIELAEIDAEIEKRQKDYTVALATRRVAEAQTAKLEEERLVLRRDLLRQRLGKLTLVSPQDGIVLGSDLDRFVGSPLTMGQTLMEIASTDRVVVDVEIPAFERRLLDEHPEVRIRMDAAGGHSVWTQLETIEPSTQIRDDQNVFVARAVIPNDGSRFRPGMVGDASINGPIRPWAWSYLRPAWERTLWWVGY